MRKDPPEISIEWLDVNIEIKVKSSCVFANRARTLSYLLGVRGRDSTGGEQVCLSLPSPGLLPAQLRRAGQPQTPGRGGELWGGGGGGGEPTNCLAQADL